MNKKGEIGETFTWIAGFLLIFFIIILFLTFSLIISAAKGDIIKNLFISDSGEIKVYGQDSSGTLDLIYFTKKDSEKIYNILTRAGTSSAVSSDKDLFVQECELYLQKNYPVDNIKFYEAKLRLEIMDVKSNKYGAVSDYSCSLSDISSKVPNANVMAVRYGFKQLAEKRVDIKIPIYSNKRLILEVTK